MDIGISYFSHVEEAAASSSLHAFCLSMPRQSDTGSSTEESESSERGFTDNMNVLYIPSSENESDHIIDEEDDKENISPVDEDKFLIFRSCLFNLFKKCLAEMQCCTPAEIKYTSFKGSMIIVKLVCQNHHTIVWKSQLLIKDVPIGNLLLAAATLYSGNTYTTLSEISDSLNLHLLSKTEFYSIQKMYLLPSISQMWNSEQNMLFERECFNFID